MEWVEGLGLDEPLEAQGPTIGPPRQAPPADSQAAPLGDACALMPDCNLAGLREQIDEAVAGYAAFHGVLYVCRKEP